MPRASLIMITLGMALAAGQASAQQTNAISRSSFIADMDAEFRKRDADGDGFITRAELQQFERARILAAARAENARVFA